MDYELVVLVRAIENQEPYTKHLTEVLQKEGFELLGDVTWENKSLAYPIKKQQSGVFVTAKIKSITGSVNTLPARFKLDETVLRYLYLKIKPPKRGKTIKKELVS